MAHVHPFAACYSPNSAVAARVATLPYDVMNRAEAAKMAEGYPDSFLHVTRSEIEFPAETDPYSACIYERAHKNWLHFRENVLSKDSDRYYYVYSLVMGGRRQTGIVAAADVAEYDNDLIRRHEKTRKDKEDDRTRHISALRAQTGPVFLTYKDSTAIDAIVAQAMAGTPLFDFTASDGIRHTGWRVPAELTQPLQDAFRQVSLLYIADGHHRAASASRTHQALTAAGTPGESDRFLGVIFPAGQLKILPYNRLVFDLNGLTAAQFLERLRQVCPVSDNASPSPASPSHVSLYLEHRWYGLDFTGQTADDPVSRLDVSLLQNLVLHPILGIGDPRTSKRIDFVGGIRGTDELQRRVDSGEAQAAFSMFPTSLDQLMEIADNNQIMPPKSTWFEPKLRDGLFVNEI